MNEISTPKVLEKISDPLINTVINLAGTASQQQLQHQLNQVYDKYGLSVALEAFFEQQITSGFISDNLEGVELASVHDPDYGVDFYAMFNPKREERAKGFGLSQPPENSGFNRVNGGCFLCMDNILWQQKGMQKGFYWNPTQSINEYNFLTNPFPIFHHHFTIASASHVIQRINNDHLRDMIQFLDWADNYLVFFNGQDAGASIPWHLHMQACVQQLPIEQARDSVVILDDAVKISLLHYPAPVIKITGTSRYLIELTGSMVVKRWLHSDPNYHNTLNFLGTKRNNEYQIYLVLRDIQKLKTSWMTGMPASVEMGGFIIWSHPNDRTKFDNFESGFYLASNSEDQFVTGLDIIKGIMTDVRPSEQTVQRFVDNLHWAKDLLRC